MAVATVVVAAVAGHRAAAGRAEPLPVVDGVKATAAGGLAVQVTRQAEAAAMHRPAVAARNSKVS